VRQPERDRAQELFGTSEQPTELALQIMKAKSTAPTPQLNGLDTDKSTTHIKLKKKEEKRFKELIRNAKSLAEIAKLEKDFAEGRIPGRADGTDEDEDMHEG
jgi:U2 small nuclear ribonucleoprotein A'